MKQQYTDHYGKPYCQTERGCSLLLTTLLGEMKTAAVWAQKPLQLVGGQADSDQEGP